MDQEIKNIEDLRVAAAKLNSAVLTMCNTKEDVEEIINNFLEAKNLLISIYKYKVESLHHKE